MKRPRIALWIRGWYSHNWIVYRPKCPDWLWIWASRRVDRWCEEQRGTVTLPWAWIVKQPGFEGLEYDARTHSIEIGDGPIFDKLWDEFRREEHIKRSTTLTGKLHR